MPGGGYSVEFERNLKKFLDLVVQDEHQGAACATENVRQSPLEEGRWSLLLEDLTPAVHGTLVQDVFAARLHHHATTDGVKGVADHTRPGGNSLGDHPAHEEVVVLSWDHGLDGVVGAEVGSSVDDDALDGHTEATVQSLDPVGLGDLGQAITESLELTATASFPDVSSQAGPGEVQGIDEAQGGCTGSATGGEVAGKVTGELGLLVHSAEEDLLVLVLEGKVESLGGKVADDIG